MGMLIAIEATVLATAMYWVAQHQAQNAADAGALSAAQDLTTADTTGTEDSAASGAATTTAELDDPGATIQATVPAAGDATSARVVVDKSVELPFGFRATAAAAATAKNNIVTNGSFDATFTTSWIEYCASNGVVYQGEWAGSFGACSASAPSMGGWSVYAGGVDLNDSSWVLAPATDPTAESIDMVGTCSYNPQANPETCTNTVNGIIDEPLATVASATYTVTFLYATNYNGPPDTKTLSVYEGSDATPAQTAGPYPGTDDLSAADATLLGTLTATIPASDPYAQTWYQSPSYQFTATSNHTYLWFVSQTGCAASTSTPTATTAVAPDCNNGAVITDVDVNGPLADNLTQ